MFANLIEELVAEDEGDLTEDYKSEQLQKIQDHAKKLNAEWRALQNKPEKTKTDHKRMEEIQSTLSRLNNHKHDLKQDKKGVYTKQNYVADRKIKRYTQPGLRGNERHDAKPKGNLPEQEN